MLHGHSLSVGKRFVCAQVHSKKRQKNTTLKSGRDWTLRHLCHHRKKQRFPIVWFHFYVRIHSKMQTIQQVFVGFKSTGEFQTLLNLSPSLDLPMLACFEDDGLFSQYCATIKANKVVVFYIFQCLVFTLKPITSLTYDRTVWHDQSFLSSFWQLFLSSWPHIDELMCSFSFSFEPAAWQGESPSGFNGLLYRRVNSTTDWWINHTPRQGVRAGRKSWMWQRSTRCRVRRLFFFLCIYCLQTGCVFYYFYFFIRKNNFNEPNVDRNKFCNDLQILIGGIIWFLHPYLLLQLFHKPYHIFAK